MKQFSINTTYTVFNNKEELPEAVRCLIEQAIAAREDAYAPYSKFNVGAALLLEGGEIVTGNNQENASYPSGLCAERVALYYAGANYPNSQIKAIAISAGAQEKELLTPVPPCGACRQAIAEYEFKQRHPIVLFFMGTSGKVIQVDALADLLPLSFSKDFLI